MHDLVCGLPCLDRGCIGQNKYAREGKGAKLLLRGTCYLFFALFFTLKLIRAWGLFTYLFVQAAFCFHFLVCFCFVQTSLELSLFVHFLFFLFARSGDCRPFVAFIYLSLFSCLDLAVLDSLFSRIFYCSSGDNCILTALLCRYLTCLTPSYRFSFDLFAAGRIWSLVSPQSFLFGLFYLPGRR